MSRIQRIQVQSPTPTSGSELSGTPAPAEPMPSSGPHRYKYTSTSNAHTYTHLKINLKKEEVVPLESVKRLREQSVHNLSSAPDPTMKGETDFHTKTVECVRLYTQNKIK